MTEADYKERGMTWVVVDQVRAESVRVQISGSRRPEYMLSPYGRNGIELSY